MHYIKCNHCGELIEVRSQYMTFCPQCEVKLNNSYAAWSAHEESIGHPGRSFNDYLSQVCVSSAAIEGTRDQRRIGKTIGHIRSARRWGVSLLIALAVVVVGLVGYKFISKWLKERSISAIMDSVWRINYYEDLGVTLKFPHNLSLAQAPQTSEPETTPGETAQQEPLPVQTDTTQVVLNSATRSWSEPRVLMVTATRIDYEPDFGVDRDVATRQILMSLLQDNELQAFEFFKNDYAIPGLDARMLSGSYLIGVDPFEFRALMVQRDSTVWYFMVAYPRARPEGLLVAERFFKGILIE